MSDYLVIQNSEDGDVRMEVVSGPELKTRLGSDHYGDNPNFFSRSDLVANGRWDFANSGARGILIVKTDAIVIPKARQTITHYEL
jgi:hypothetical protein